MYLLNQITPEQTLLIRLVAFGMIEHIIRTLGGASDNTFPVIACYSS